ncbi:MAG TPA: hypothetical protein VGE28_16280 [Pseudomonas sp.]
MPSIRIEVPDEFYKALIVADMIIHSVKGLYWNGAGNQRADNKPEVLPNNFETDHANFYRLNAVRHMATNTYGARQILDGIETYKPRRSAFSALQMGVGNCGERADLAYVLCREYFDRSWTVAITSATRTDHAFVVVWKNMEDIDIVENGLGKRVEPIIVVDPWPQKAQALLWEHFFIHDGSLPRDAQNVCHINVKPGKGAHFFDMSRLLRWKNYFMSAQSGAAALPPEAHMIPSFTKKALFQNGLAPDEFKNHLLGQSPDMLRSAFAGWCLKQYNETNHSNLQQVEQLPQHIQVYIRQHWDDQRHMEEKAIADHQYNHQFASRNDRVYDYQPHA